MQCYRYLSQIKSIVANPTLATTRTTVYASFHIRNWWEVKLKRHYTFELTKN